MAKTTCPVCFTKMNQVGHDLVCPECGYKYCEGRTPYTYDDHNHNQYETYNHKTTYTSQSASAQTSYPQRSSSAPQYSSVPQPSVSRPQSSNPQGQRPKRNSAGTVVWFLVIIYILIMMSRIFLGH